MIGSQSRYTSAHIGQRLHRRLNAGHGGAIELHLLPHVPIQRARREPLEALNDAVLEPGRPGINRADRGDLAFGGIASVHQRHEVGRCDAIDTQ